MRWKHYIRDAQGLTIKRTTRDNRAFVADWILKNCTPGCTVGRYADIVAKTADESILAKESARLNRKRNAK